MKKKKSLRIIFIFITIILCVGIGTGGAVYSYLSEFSKGLKNNGSIIDPSINKNKEEPINVLIMGVDIGTPGTKSANNNQRTDTIILLNYNPKTENTNIISIPRDTLIKINGKNQKINAANVFGGVKYVIESVQQLLDVKVNYYAKLDYTGFREIIDIIGGVDVTIKRRMDYDDPAQNLHIHFKKGETVHLDGKKAEEFFRWRKNNDGTGLVDGDLGRIENQHLFIEKVMEKFKNPSIIAKIPSILKAVPKYVETNMPASDILLYGSDIAKINKENISMTTLQGDLTYVDDVSYLVYDSKKNKEILDILHGESEAVMENSVLQKDKVKIQVLNGTKKAGMAGEIASRLKTDGYLNVSTGNGAKTAKSSVTVYGMDESYRELIKKEINIENIVFKSTKDGSYDIVAVLGEDYKGK